MFHVSLRGCFVLSGPLEVGVDFLHASARDQPWPLRHAEKKELQWKVTPFHQDKTAKKGWPFKQTNLVELTNGITNFPPVASAQFFTSSKMIQSACTPTPVTQSINLSQKSWRTTRNVQAWNFNLKKKRKHPGRLTCWTQCHGSGWVFTWILPSNFRWTYFRYPFSLNSICSFQNHPKGWFWTPKKIGGDTVHPHFFHQKRPHENMGRKGPVFPPSLSSS